MTSADIIANLWSSGNQSLWVRAKVQSGQCLAQNQKDIVLDTQDPCEKKTGMMVCAYNYSAGKEATGGSLGYFLARQPSLINKPRCCLKTTRKVPEEWQLGLSSVPHTRVHVNMDNPHRKVGYSEALQWTGGHSFYSHAHILSSACELAFPPYVVVLNTERLNCSGIIDWPHLWLH